MQPLVSLKWQPAPGASSVPLYPNNCHIPFNHTAPPPPHPFLQLGEDKPFLEMLPDVIKSYGMSMMYGHSHTSQSLPRMLTLWFEFGTFLHAFRAASKGAVSLCSVLQ